MENIFRKKSTKILLSLLTIFTLQAQVLSHRALARPSGGGELQKFDTGQFALSVGIGLASSTAGNILSSGIDASLNGADFLDGGITKELVGGAEVKNFTDSLGSFTSATKIIGGSVQTTAYAGFKGALANYGGLGTWMSNFNSMAAFNQLGSGINMVGQAQKWGVPTTVFVSSVAQGVVGGLLNPSGTLEVSPAKLEEQIEGNALNITGQGLPFGTLDGLKVGVHFSGWDKTMMSAVPNYTFSNALKSAAVGAVSGITEGAILANNVDRKGNIEPWISGAAGVTGSLAGGIVSAGIDEVIPNSHLHKANTLEEAFIHGTVNLISSVPSGIISAGVSSITKDMDKQDAFMVRQSFSGLYPIAGSVYTHTIKEPFMEKVWPNYLRYDGTGKEDFKHRPQTYLYKSNLQE
ncbi:MAG: hypothetical protein ABIE75_02140 [Candidatus Omnitrophota bacterium]